MRYLFVSISVGPTAVKSKHTHTVTAKLMGLLADAEADWEACGLSPSSWLGPSSRMRASSEAASFSSRASSSSTIAMVAHTPDLHREHFPCWPAITPPEGVMRTRPSRIQTVSISKASLTVRSPKAFSTRSGGGNHGQVDRYTIPGCSALFVKSRAVLQFV